jgi:hypothetical protein
MLSVCLYLGMAGAFRMFSFSLTMIGGWCSNGGHWRRKVSNVLKPGNHRDHGLEVKNVVSEGSRFTLVYLFTIHKVKFFY